MGTVADEEISAAILQLMEKTKTIVEGAGATTLAALLYKKFETNKKNIACVLSGGNIDVTTLAYIIERGLVQEGRMVKLGIELDDKPGMLNQLTKVVADIKANIMHVEHDRLSLYLPYGRTVVSLTLETRGHPHIQELLSALKKNGYLVRRMA